MKERCEIQRAHDLLEPIARGEVPTPAGMNAASLLPVLGVLCWVLEDRNSREFACFLQQVERRMEAAGYTLGEPVPFPMMRRPGRE